jgi:hypothetical protein
MEFGESIAIISIAGFAVQRTLELLDPVIAGIMSLWQRRHEGKLPWGLTENAFKTWLMTFSGFVISLPVAWLSKVQIFHEAATSPTVLDVVIGALAISAGINGVNSLLKFGELSKDSRKIEVKPLPDVKVNPSSVTIRTGTTVDILATVTGTDTRTVTWEVLEGASGGAVTPVPTSLATGRYTAPAAAGEYHVAAISQANPSANAVATIKVVV